jgi:hypothetical protein
MNSTPDAGLAGCAAVSTVHRRDSNQPESPIGARARTPRTAIHPAGASSPRRALSSECSEDWLGPRQSPLAGKSRWTPFADRADLPAPHHQPVATSAWTSAPTPTADAVASTGVRRVSEGGRDHGSHRRAGLRVLRSSHGMLNRGVVTSSSDLTFSSLQ